MHSSDAFIYCKRPTCDVNAFSDSSVSRFLAASSIGPFKVPVHLSGIALKAVSQLGMAFAIYTSKMKGC